MGKKMSVMGVGGKIGVVVLAALAITETVSLLAPVFQITKSAYGVLVIIGVALIVVGFSLNMVAAVTMLKATKENKLATSGLYSVFRDPMYVLQIFITMPGLLLLFNSWLVLVTLIPAYLAYRIFVKQEHSYLSERYGEAYNKYIAGVPVKL